MLKARKYMHLIANRSLGWVVAAATAVFLSRQSPTFKYPFIGILYRFACFIAGIGISRAVLDATAPSMRMEIDEKFDTIENLHRQITSQT